MNFFFLFQTFLCLSILNLGSLLIPPIAIALAVCKLGKVGKDQRRSTVRDVSGGSGSPAQVLATFHDNHSEIRYFWWRDYLKIRSSWQHEYLKMSVQKFTIRDGTIIRNLRIVRKTYEANICQIFAAQIVGIANICTALIKTDWDFHKKK